MKSLVSWQSRKFLEVCCEIQTSHQHPGATFLWQLHCTCHCKGFPEMFHRFFSQIFFGWCCYKCGSRFVFTSLMSYLLDDKWAPRFECRLPTPFHKQEMLRWPAERPLPGHPVGIHIYKCAWGRVGVRIQILRLQPQIRIDDPPSPPCLNVCRQKDCSHVETASL